MLVLEGLIEPGEQAVGLGFDIHLDPDHRRDKGILLGRDQDGGIDPCGGAADRFIAANSRP